jgi:hypothetical protein
MGAWNGIGTKYMGLVRAEDPRAYYATKWFVVAHLPVLPLRREKVIFGEKEMVSLYSESQAIEILEEVPLSFANILQTWFLSWFVVVPLTFGPIVLTILGANKDVPPFFTSKAWVIFSMVWTAVAVIYFAHRDSRGIQV